MPPAEREVWITGVGMITPAGRDTRTTWQNLLAGRRCVEYWKGSLGPFGEQKWLAASVKDVVEAADERVCSLAFHAAREAISSSGWSLEQLQDRPAGRLRIAVGTSKGSLPAFAALLDGLAQPRAAGVTRSQWTQWLNQGLPDAAARFIARQLGFKCPIDVPVAACATGAVAVIQGAAAVAADDADIVLCGSSDACLHPLWFSALEQMGVLAAEHPDLGPGYACRPFDRTRCGFSLGEGAAMLVIEAADVARRRGSAGFARISGWALGGDPAGIAQVTVGGKPLAGVVRQACQRAGCDPGAITCVHAHGTGTLPNDVGEIAGLRLAMGSALRDIPVVSLKPMLGHLLGGAGSVELAAAALSCQSGTLPGNINLLQPDPSLGQLCLPTGVTELSPGPVLKTSLGFGGHLAAVVLEPVVL